jgi:hypothetical protein
VLLEARVWGYGGMETEHSSMVPCLCYAMRVAGVYAMVSMRVAGMEAEHSSMESSSM